MSDYSIVDWHSEHEGYRCGYCKSLNTNYSHGMSAYKLTVEDYQDLIDRGWRRSGTYVYKPTMKKTCCPQYPVRCDAVSFHLSQSQKKVLKRVNRYLNYGVVPGKGEDQEVHEVFDHSRENVEYMDSPATEVKVSSGVGKKPTPEDVGTASHTQKSDRDTGKHHQPKPGLGEDPTKPKCKKAKLRRLEKKKLKCEKRPAVENKCTNIGNEQVKSVGQKTLEDYLDEIIENPAHKLEIRLVRSSPTSEEFEEMFSESYNIFKKYQINIHKEDESECSLYMYKGFLVESPLQAQNGSLPHGFGSFHQLYLLDGKVIAVGVIDILPRCVSSVYLYYDPDYNFLSLGTYSALRELAFTRQLHSLCSDISYYYLGFYIHSCPKMRYKGQYSPSFLLCPETYTWHRIEECSEKLNEQKYCRFAEPGIADKDGTIDMNDILVLHKHQVMPYKIYRTMKPKTFDKNSVNLYAMLIGMACARKILLYRP